MPPKVKKLTADIERRIAIGAIVSDQFLRDIIPVMDEQLLQVPFIRSVLLWSKEYYEKYSRAPREEISSILKAKIRTGGIIEAEQEPIEEFLGELSDQWERESNKYNADYWLDEAERYLDTRRIQTTVDDVSAYLAEKDLDKARSLVTEYQQVRRPSSQAFNPFTNRDIITRVFKERAEPLFTMPGDLGTLVNPLFHRKSFVGLLAPEKRGKTFFLIQTGYQAVKSKCNVAFFAVGDMTEEEMTERIAMLITGKTTREWDCGTHLVPVLDCRWNQRDTCRFEEREGAIPCMYLKDGKWYTYDRDDEEVEDYIPCSVCREAPKRSRRKKWKGAHWWVKQRIKLLSRREALQAGKKFVKRHGDRWRQFVYEDGALSVSVIEAELQQLRDREGWVPDVVIVDYADLMDPEIKQTSDERHKHNAIWRGLNALRKRWSVCLITATQANRGGHEQSVDLTLVHQSEDKRKAGHVTAMLGLNQNEQEEKEGTVRVAILAARGSGAKSRGQVRCLRVLEIGRPLIGSYFV